MTSLVLIGAVQLAAMPSQADQFETAYQRSLASGRPLVVLLGADWCPSCRVMQKEVMPKVEKSGALADVEFVYIDIDRRRDLAAKLSKADTIPQLIRYYKTPDGWRYDLLNGAYGAAEVKAFLQTGSIKPLTARNIPNPPLKGVKK